MTQELDEGGTDYLSIWLGHTSVRYLVYGGIGQRRRCKPQLSSPLL